MVFGLGKQTVNGFFENENFVLILLRGDNLGGVVMWRYITP